MNTIWLNKIPTIVWSTASVNNWESVKQSSVLCGSISVGNGEWGDNDDFAQMPIKFMKFVWNCPMSFYF